MGSKHERLAAAIKQKGLDQKTFAEKLGVSTATISRILSGQYYLDFDAAVKACELLDITLDWLAYGREPPSPDTPYYRDPERQRIEYLLSILKKTEYPAVIVALEGIIEIRLDTDSEQ
jgi:transcriptional regulator with XRE-family HTH domain